MGITCRGRPGDLDHLRDPVGERLEVADGRLDVDEDRPDASLERRELVRRCVAAGLEVHDRLPQRRLTGMENLDDPTLAVALGADHGMDDETDLEAAGAQLLRDGVDEERGVHSVRLDDRSHRGVPVACERRVERADGERLGTSAVGQFEYAHDLPEQLLGVEVYRDLGRDAPHVRARELAHDTGALGRDVLLDLRK